MAHPRVDAFEGVEENARRPQVDVRDFADTRGGALRSEGNVVYVATAAPGSSPTQHETKGSDTIVLRTHDGEGYVLPYLSWETTKSHIEDIYKLRYRETLAEAVKDDNFSLKTEDGNIILPAFWDQVVKPAATVQIVLSSDMEDAPRYRYDDDAPRRRYRSRSRSISPSLDSAQERRAGSPRKDSEEVSGSEGGSDDDEDDYTSSESGDDLSLDSTDSESESPSVAVISVAVSRQVTSPIDEEGNNLVFKVNTTLAGPLERDAANATDASSKRDPQQTLGNTESISIAKAVSSQADDRTWLQIFVLKGPRTISTDHDESIRWFHLRSSPLDLAGFKETCLSIPGLSGRLQKLIRRTFDKVEKEKLKVSLDGMFIEPGTVLRADESQQSDPESVIFSCVPFFNLQVPARKKSTTGLLNQFPSRTLMQSYYPYEPVQDRDADQAYRKFGNEQRDALVHVPNLWMVNIGSNIVATCSHQALQDGFVQSIQLVPMNRSRVKDSDLSTNIRLTDWDGRKLLYTVEECRSYFQLEQRLKELSWCSSRSRGEKNLQPLWKTNGTHVKVTPQLWTGILGQKDALFIDLSLSTEAEEKDEGNGKASSPKALGLEPFFQWPQKSGTVDEETRVLFSDKIKRSFRCLEVVEKAMTSEVLSSDESYSAVERTFTSTNYYLTLGQCTAEDVMTSLQALQTIETNLKKPREGSLTSHQAVVFRQKITIAQKTSELCDYMHQTLALFVADVDKTTMLRKSWAAMQNVCDIAISVLGHEPRDSKPETSAVEEGNEQPAGLRKWLVRPEISDEVTTEPLKKLKQSFEKCRKCGGMAAYNTPEAALVHAQKHFKYAGLSGSSTSAPDNCVIESSQMLLEIMNRGPVNLLTTACQKAQQLLSQARDLSEGVLNEDGQISDLYTLPRSLLSAFRQMLVFYFAVERAMFYIEDTHKKARDPVGKPDYKSMTRFSSSVQAIETFAVGVQQALAAARTELCSMVKSPGPVEVFKRLSLSPEYVCSWLMRRLIVKPLEKSMTVSDMYREYLSTIQFQVNHRPGKRLLRSINLLQEEIAALQEVNTQQNKLITNYMSVLDDTTYETDLPHRKSMYHYERMLLSSIQDSLQMTDQEYRYLLTRCGPLSDSTKQSLEINEEDHGKAILVFTVVTVIFLPLSFVTSYLGMNTTDIRDMGSSSTLFWAIAIPLTTLTMGSVMYIGYNGDSLRDSLSALYRRLTGGEDRRASARGISVAQRKQARRSATDSSNTLDFSSLADEAEFASPRPEDQYRSAYHHRTTYPPRPQHFSALDPPAARWETYASAAVLPEPRTGLRTAPLRPNISYEKEEDEDEWFVPEPMRRTRTRRRSEESLPERPGPAYARAPPRLARLHHDELEMDSRPTYVRRDEAVPSGYEWTKQSSHRPRRSTRHRPRRSRRADDADSAI